MKKSNPIHATAHKDALDQELEAELTFHLQHQIEKNVAKGMTPEQAHAAALRSFGGVDQVKEECRDAWGVRVIERLIQDARFTLRMLVKNPGFTAVTVLTLALGIGAITTIFSWINGTLLNPVPGASHMWELVTVMRGPRTEHPTPPFSYLDYRDVRDHVQSLSGLLAYHDDFMSITENEKPERIYGALTSANYFEVLGVHPTLGRAFTPEEELSTGSGRVAVISDGLWRARYSSDRSVVGKTIQINRILYTIIGVAPPGFQGCKTGLRSDIWIPLVMDPFVWGGPRPERRGTFWLNVLGRLKPGVDRHAAESELNLVMQRIIATSGNIDRGPSQITLDPLWRSPFGVNVYLYRTLPLLLGLAGALLLLACANVANLLVVRCVGRQREIAIRLAVGASRWRLTGQLLVESMILALAGGALAAVVTTGTAGWLGAFITSTTLPLTLAGRNGTHMLLATLALSMASAVVFGVLPALRTSQLAPVTVLKEEAGSVSGGGRKSRLTSMLVVAQIALSLLLLVCAGLFVRSLRNAQRVDTGFDPNHVLLSSYELIGYHRADAWAFDRQLLSRLQNIPGVESAALADFSPLNFSLHSDIMYPDGYQPQPHESMEISRAIVSANYFRTLRTPVITGREFTAQDTDTSQLVAIVNQEFCDRYWPGEEAVGKRLRNAGVWFNVVGVVRNAKYRRLVYGPEPVVFLAASQVVRGAMTIHVRVAGEPSNYAAAVTRTVHDLNPDLPVFDVATLRSSMLLGSVFERVAGTFAGGFGLLALVLAAVGLYGVISYSTRQRTHEMAIRMAIGAARADIFRLVLAQGLRLTFIGLAVGIALALIMTRYLHSVLFGITSTDVMTYAFVVLLLCVVSLLACFVPARRATRVEPMVALHHD